MSIYASPGQLEEHLATTSGRLLAALTATVLLASLLVQCLPSEPEYYAGIPTAGLDSSKTTKSLAQARQDWYEFGKQIIHQGLAQFPSYFQVMTEVGPKIVLPNRFAQEIRNHPDLHFGKAISAEFFGAYPGFEPFGNNSASQVVVNTVRGRLTQSLNFITKELAEETSKAINELFGDAQDWTEVTYKPILLQMIARVSSRVFIGPELCANEEWLNITQKYVVDSFIAIHALREWHPILRPIVHWVLPECHTLRATLAKARTIIAPVIQQHRASTRIAREAGKDVSKVADTIGWMDEAAKGQPYDAATAQLGLSFAAIHTTTEMVSGLISDLCANPEIFEPLRQEIRSVLGSQGWSKQALHRLELLDSVMKESQRHHFGDISAMHRIAEKPITLSEGIKIPKNAFTMVSIEKMQDTDLFPEPSTFKGDRFLKMRKQPGQENRWQFVTSSPERLAFGHGKHSCPGRFFAANEIKVIMIHLLMMYDWEAAEEGIKKDQVFGAESEADPTAKVMIRKRESSVGLRGDVSQWSAEVY